MQKVRRLFINTKRNQFEEGRCSKRKEKKKNWVEVETGPWKDGGE